MTVNQKLASLLKKSAFAAAAVFSLAQCSEEETLKSPAVSGPSVQATARSPLNASITSLTISGINTSFATAENCETCTYVVPEGTRVVDGKELGLKPGSIICLNTIFKYGDLELSNIEGTEDNPIVITIVGENINDPSIQATAANGDPY